MPRAPIPNPRTVERLDICTSVYVVNIDTGKVVAKFHPKPGDRTWKASLKRALQEARGDALRRGKISKYTFAVMTIDSLY